MIQALTIVSLILFLFCMFLASALIHIKEQLDEMEKRLPPK